MLRIFVAVFLFLISCSQGSDFTSSKDVKINNPLAEGDLIYMDISVADDGDYDLWLRAGHTQEYGYENVYLKYHMLDDRDTLLQGVSSIELMSDGKQWTGEATSLGFMASRSVGNIRLKGSKVYRVGIGQYSREKNLDGINLLGASLKE